MAKGAHLNQHWVWVSDYLNGHLPSESSVANFQRLTRCENWWGWQRQTKAGAWFGTICTEINEVLFPCNETRHNKVSYTKSVKTGNSVPQVCPIPQGFPCQWSMQEGKCYELLFIHWTSAVLTKQNQIWWNMSDIICSLAHKHQTNQSETSVPNLRTKQT